MSDNFNAASIRELEHASIRRFVLSCSEHLTGQVLDFGCGKQPYRDIVEIAGGTYTPFDRGAYAGNVSGEDVGPEGGWSLVLGGGRWDAVLCTQVLQYVRHPDRVLTAIRHGIRPGGHLILSYACCWDWIEPEDKWRFTPAGMADLLVDAGFRVEESTRRAEVNLGGFRFPLGYGTVASVC
jgi:SAM-dependent methyltransferase